MTSRRTGRPTLRTVAEAAQVSTATVSYVMRGRTDGIHPETAARVRAAATAVGYRPNRSAQAMRTGRTGIVLLALDQNADPWSQGIANAIATAAAVRGMTSVVLADREWVTAIDRLQPDVTLIDLPEQEDPSLTELSRLARAQHRVVIISDTAQAAGVDIVRSPATHGAALILEHLTERTDDIAFIVSRRTHEFAGSGSTNRVHAYNRAVASGAVRRERIIQFESTATDAYRAAYALLARLDRPRAICANTDFVAVEVLNAARALGLRVPEDLFVTGMGHSEAAALSHPPITTAGPIDFFERLAEILIDSVDRPALGEEHVFEWELIPRESTSPLTDETP